MNKILITSIYAYCGGTLVLFTLCKELRAIGYDARIFLVPNFGWYEKERNLLWREYLIKIGKKLLKHYIRQFLCLLFPQSLYAMRNRLIVNDILQMEGVKLKVLPWFNKDKTIVIYPDNQYGNPLKAKYVVRWLLMNYKFELDRNAYSKNDVFVAFRKFFDSNTLNPNGYCVTLNHFDSSLYRRYNYGERKGNCYILHKGKSRTDLPDKYDGPVYVDGKSMSQIELVEYLNHCEKCYCYDPQSFFAKIAVVCGCKCIVVMEPGKKEQDYLGPGERHLGIAYGETQEQMNFAENTRDDLLQSLDFDISNRRNAIEMVRIIEENFGKIALK